jgi:hypothetical protein
MKQLPEKERLIVQSIRRDLRSEAIAIAINECRKIADMADGFRGDVSLDEAEALRDHVMFLHNKLSMLAKAWSKTD